MNLNILICGNDSTGKSSFIYRHRMNNNLKFTLYSNDMEGSNFSASREGSNFDGCIILSDLTRYNTVLNSVLISREIRNKFGNALPIIICGNKYDKNDRQVYNNHIIDIINYEYPYFDISCETLYNIGKPILHIIRTIQNDFTIE
jgi:GTPase SAR1 family protein